MTESSHALERTSPMGEKFVGTCMKCGKTGLTFADMAKPCENTAGMSDADALLKTLEKTETENE